MKDKKQTNKTWYYSSNIKKLGSKQEPYYKTELEMLVIKKYTYDSLSESEKLIYNQNKDETRNNKTA